MREKFTIRKSHFRFQQLKFSFCNLIPIILYAFFENKNPFFYWKTNKIWLWSVKNLKISLGNKQNFCYFTEKITIWNFSMKNSQFRFQQSKFSFCNLIPIILHAFKQQKSFLFFKKLIKFPSIKNTQNLTLIREKFENFIVK